MDLPSQAIIEYQEIYKKVFGVNIPLNKATEQGTKLLNLFQIIYKPYQHKNRVSKKI